MRPLHLKFGEVSNKIPSLASWICVCFEYTFVDLKRRKNLLPLLLQEWVGGIVSL